MIILLYTIFTYLFMLGMLAQSFKEKSNVPREIWLVWLISPIAFPIFMGMYFGDNNL
jgi:hypothetical protein